MVIRGGLHYVIKKGNTVYRIQCAFEGGKDIDKVLIRLDFKNADRDKRYSLVKFTNRTSKMSGRKAALRDYLFSMIGVRFIALNDGVDTLNSDNDIMPFKNLFNEFQSKETSKKIKAVKQMHAKAGNYLGAYVPYGYKHSPEDKHRFLIDEEAAENVRKLFDYRCQGYGYRKIAGLMNEQHILPPRDYYYLTSGRESAGYRNHLWNEVTIKKTIRNEVYLGHMVQNKRGTDCGY